MHRVRFAIVTALVVPGSLAPWSAGAAPPHAGTAAPTPDAAPININTADVKELMKLEGVGRKVAEKIVEYREHDGRCQKLESIPKLEGICSGLGDRSHARIVGKYQRPQICIWHSGSRVYDVVKSTA